jgi:hypothetical protein
MAEAARTILEGEIDLPGGVFTTPCLGQRYVDHLSAAGLELDAKMVPA